jgi:hypothetical protein
MQLTNLQQQLSALVGKDGTLINFTHPLQHSMNGHTSELQMVQHRHQRARFDDHESQERSPLSSDQILDAVFTYVGIGDYVYAGGVSRRWKGRYVKLCHSSAAKGKKDKLVTTYASALMTATRLQLAMDSRLELAGLHLNQCRTARIIVMSSLEPIALLSLLKLYDFKWGPWLTFFTASRNMPQLLQWLHKYRCPMTVGDAALGAVRNDNVEMLEWLRSLDSAWTAETKQRLLWRAGKLGHIASLKWLREHGIAWSVRDSFYRASDTTANGQNECWPVRAVQWSLSNGCDWGVWQCTKLVTTKFECDCKSNTSTGSEVNCNEDWCMKRNALELYKWAHENGCPCTCAADAAAAAAVEAAAAAEASAAAAAAAAALQAHLAGGVVVQQQQQQQQQ